MAVQITPLASIPKPPSYTKEHHVGSPPTSFRNPWPSFEREAHGLGTALRARFLPNKERNFVPVPTDRAELVSVMKPDWGRGKSGLKATWIGHASWLVEVGSGVCCGSNAGGAGGESSTGGQKDGNRSNKRGIAILLDPVFSDRMSPVSFAGPKRFTPPPCALQELPEVDIVLISHNHYDHLDVATIRFIHERGKGHARFLCGLGVKSSLLSMGVGNEEVLELDWWDGVEVGVGDAKARLVCTPSQHFSGRSIWDAGCGLWCSWIIEELPGHDIKGPGKKLYFAGDTGYRTVPEGTSAADVAALPHCPAFKDIGELYGPFDLALLPIGCFLPRTMMSPIHCAPEDSICIHRDVRSRKSMGMHYGTVRGAMSECFEDVRDPPRLWRTAAEEAGLVWGEEICLCAVGETVVV
ncbi:beta-lactamase superfamily domain-containing protein [Phyllosticta citriasiana]|uniref:Beta-lactamase superfamily domain-containing protein n=1 Tax=Phyllosticta citriasiana TaxID=595635 RepID=A0ABR1L480_9PEZI